MSILAARLERSWGASARLLARVYVPAQADRSPTTASMSEKERPGLCSTTTVMLEVIHKHER